MFQPSEVTIKEMGPAFPYKWILQHDLVYEGHTVGNGFDTDLASVPQPITWLFPRYGLYTKAAIVHDHICRNSGDRFAADRVFLEAMKGSHVPYLRRNIMWAAVNWAAIAGHLFKNLTMTAALALVVYLGIRLGLLQGLGEVQALIVWGVAGLVGIGFICSWTTTVNTYWAVLRGLVLTMLALPFLVVSLALGVILVIYLFIENPIGCTLSLIRRLWMMLVTIFRAILGKLRLPTPTADPEVAPILEPSRERLSHLLAPSR